MSRGRPPGGRRPEWLPDPEAAPTPPLPRPAGARRPLAASHLAALVLLLVLAAGFVAEIILDLPLEMLGGKPVVFVAVIALGLVLALAAPRRR